MENEINFFKSEWQVRWNSEPNNCFDWLEISTVPMSEAFPWAIFFTYSGNRKHQKKNWANKSKWKNNTTKEESVLSRRPPYALSSHYFQWWFISTKGTLFLSKPILKLNFRELSYCQGKVNRFLLNRWISYGVKEVLTTIHSDEIKF